ncbi:MAG: YggT family protein [Gemmatimonadaceae bacterium]
MTALAVFDQILGAVRFVVAITAAVFALFCVLDWLVRTRRVNLFGPLARFTRSRIDPVLEPIERKILKAGGNPATAPLWALGVVVVGGILLINVLDFIRGEVVGVAFAFQSGPRGIFKLLVAWTFNFLQIALLVRVISSWLPVSPYSPWIRWSHAISEPILRPLRQVVPTMGPIDITPIIAYFLLGFLQGAVMRLL